MTLKDLNIGETAVVGTVGGEGALRQHFLDTLSTFQTSSVMDGYTN